MLPKSVKLACVSATWCVLNFLSSMELSCANPVPGDFSAVSLHGDAFGASEDHFAPLQSFDEHQHEFFDDFAGHGVHDYAEAFNDHHSISNDIDAHSEFDGKPVPGIDHGKGAFSYSTLYEFKEPDAY